MKKTYMRPSTKAMNVATQVLLEASSPGPKPKISPNETTTVMESRRSSHSVWDEDEGEEE